MSGGILFEFLREGGVVEPLQRVLFGCLGDILRETLDVDEFVIVDDIHGDCLTNLLCV